tara:strand:- start:113 stop:607 length:495 start_codon:yes stop_codon:yes gene_type:complete
MKKLLIYLILIVPLFVFSQGQEKNYIEWMTLKQAEEYSEKHQQNIFILFYRPGCDYCERMKKETLSDPLVIKQINENFLPVMINGKSKQEMIYSGKKYINDASIEEDPKATWRHNLYAELVDPWKEQYYWPNIVVINYNKQKILQLNGFQPKSQLLRSIKKLVK